MADTTTLESVASQAQGNGNGVAEPTKPPAKATVPADPSVGELADDELSQVPKAKLGAKEQGIPEDVGDEEDEYDFEEEQQAAEGEDDEYHVDDEDEGDEYRDEEGEGDSEYQPEAPNGAATAGKPNLTALLLGNPNDAEDDEEEYNGEDDDEDAEYHVEDDEEDEGDDYMEESTPITPTSKKRGIQEAREDDEDEEVDEEEQGASKKKVRS